MKINLANMNEWNLVNNKSYRVTNSTCLDFGFTLSSLFPYKEEKRLL